MAVQRLIGVTQADVQDFVTRENLFTLKGATMDVDSFKRMFFPTYFQVEKDVQSEEDEREIESEQVVLNKVTKVETLIKDKLAANWVSVRKAFLDLDTDYDGYVTVEDILRVLGEEGRTLNFNDLTKLIIDKDQKRRGRINYTDFSKWLGGVIQQSEGFYFRHDSHKNPQYERTAKAIVDRYETLNRRVLEEQIEQMDLSRTVLGKIWS